MVHLLSVPFEWIRGGYSKEDWLSIWIIRPDPSFQFYGELRSVRGRSQSCVLVHRPDWATAERRLPSLGPARRVTLMSCPEDDDSENLDSKVLGVDAWLQREIVLEGHQRVISIYGADLDIGLPDSRGVLSDGMGYVFIRRDLNAVDAEEQAGFLFLQLG